MHSGMVYKAAEAVSLCQFSGLVHKRLKCANIVSTYFCRYLLLMHCEFSFQTCPKCEDSFCRRMIYAIAILLNLQHPLPIDTSKPQNQPAHCYTLAWREFLFPFLDASLFFLLLCHYQGAFPSNLLLPSKKKRLKTKDGQVYHSKPSWERNKFNFTFMISAASDQEVFILEGLPFRRINPPVQCL